MKSYSMYIFFLVSLVLHSIIILRLTHVIAFINCVTLYIAEYYSVDKNVTIHSQTDLHLHCFQFLSTTNNAAMNIPVCLYMDICFLLGKYLERNDWILW